MKPIELLIMGIMNSTSGAVATLFRQDLYSGSGASGTHILDASTIGDDRDQQDGRYYQFDGTDDIIQLSTDITLSSDFTVTAWFKTSVTGVQVLIGGSGSIRVGQSSTSISIYDGATLRQYTFANFADSNWHHFAMTRSSGTVQVYLDGIESSSGGQTASNSFTIARVGAWNSGNHFTGNAFDVRVYNDVLTEDERNYVYTFGIKGTDPSASNLQLHYKCDEGAGITAFDSSGNSNDGTITNATLSSFHQTGNDAPHSYQNDVGFSNVMYFDGTDTHVEFALADFSGPSMDETWELEWDCYQISGNEGGIFGQNGLNLGVTLRNSGSLIIDTGSDPQTVAAVDVGYTQETWETFKITHDGSGGLELFVGGSSVWTGTTTDTGDLWGQFCIGTRRLSVPSTNFNGYIKNVKFVQNSSTVIDCKLRNGSGERAIDDSTNSYHGTIDNSNGDDVWVRLPRDESSTDNDISGSPLQYSGRAPRKGKFVNSNCGTFDGTDDYVDVPDVGNLGSAFSLSAWIKTSNSAAQGILSQYTTTGNKRSIRFLKESTGEIGIYLSDDGANATLYSGSDTDIDDGNWHHVLLTFNNTNLKFYVDNFLDAERTTTQTAAFSTDAPFSIGSGFNSGSELFNGQIADVRIFNKELSTAEIEYVYTNGGSGTAYSSSDVFAHFPIAEGYGTSLYDVSGNDNHGTATNITESTFWGTKQDVYPYNITSGFEEYDDDATGNNIIRVPYKTDGTQITPTISGYTKNQNNPAGEFHNQAESHIDFSDNTNSPFSLIKYGRLFNGSSDDVVIANLFTGFVVNSDFSIAMWFKSTNAPTANEHLVSWSNGTDEHFTIGIDDADIGCRLRVDGVNNDADVLHTPDSEWHHIAFTWDYSTTTLIGYLDGVVMDNAGGPPISPNFGSNFVFGARQNAAGNFFDGRLADVRYYDDILTADEVMYLYGQNEDGTDPTDTNLQGHWFTDDDDVLDKSGNGNDGTNDGTERATETIPTDYTIGDRLPPPMRKIISTDGNESSYQFPLP